MGFRFRKSVKIAPGVRINLGTRGSSLSVGRRGATVNFGKKGTKVTVGIPGSGISYSETIQKNTTNSKQTSSTGGFIALLFIVWLLYSVFSHHN